MDDARDTVPFHPGERLEWQAMERNFLAWRLLIGPSAVFAIAAIIAWVLRWVRRGGTGCSVPPTGLL